MSYYIRSLEQARAIITAYERCSSVRRLPPPHAGGLALLISPRLRDAIY